MPLQIEPIQRTAAKVAGFFYLLTIITANFVEFYVRQRLIVPGDALQSARNITASGQFFRIGIACDLIAFAAGVILVAALYVVLKPISRNMGPACGFLGTYRMRHRRGRHCE